MTYLPPDILVNLVECLRQLFVDSSPTHPQQPNGYCRQLSNLRLVSRMFAASPVVKAALFQQITLRVTHRSGGRLKATYSSIAPYVSTLTIQASVFDSTISEGTYFNHFHDEVWATVPDNPEIEILNSYKDYHARALKDQAAEDEIAKTWLECVKSFRNLKELHISSAFSSRYSEFDAGVYEKSSFLELIKQKNKYDSFFIQISQNTGSRLLKLALPLLCTPDVQPLELVLQCYMKNPIVLPDTASSLRRLKTLNFDLHIPNQEPAPYNSDDDEDSVEDPIPTESELPVIAARLSLLHAILDISQTSLEELTITRSGGHLFLPDDELFPSHIRCDRLQSLHFNSVYVSPAQLISTMLSAVQNLKQITFTNPEAGTYSAAPVETFWPDFFTRSRALPSERRLGISGESEGSFSALRFGVMLNKPYQEALIAYRNKRCNAYTALSVAIRLFVDGIITWDVVGDVRGEIEDSWPGEFGGSEQFV